MLKPVSAYKRLLLTALYTSPASSYGITQAVVLPALPARLPRLPNLPTLPKEDLAIRRMLRFPLAMSVMPALPTTLPVSLLLKLTLLSTQLATQPFTYPRDSWAT